ncbi:MAG TPA: S8 family serine peptidase, partial [Planctomycetota bacterium]|nr:S8 family serine peptidase [Planctomycetota bacterium]
MHPFTAHAVLLALLTAGAGVHGQEPLPIVGARGPGMAVYGDRIEVKLRDELDAQLQDGVLVAKAGGDLGAVPQLFARATAEPLVTSVPRERLDEWYLQARRTLPPQRWPGRMTAWFRLRTESRAPAEALVDALLACPQVEHCYLEARPGCARSGAADIGRVCIGATDLGGGNDPAPPTPLFTSLQTYLGPTPIGIGMRQANVVLGCRGQGVHVLMVEEGWVFDHEDVTKLVTGNVIGPVPLPDSTANHGLAGTSLLVADRNCFGMTGMVDETDIHFLSLSAIGGTTNTVLLAAAQCRPGDVIMMILQLLLGQVGPDDWVPIEYLQAEFDAVATATAAGCIVVASAANGGNSLDDPRFMRRFDRGYRDSGAIFVAATNGSAMNRAAFANYGSRVDANGWGENVVAAGFGTLFFGANDPRQSYTAAYAGTSAATPMVTGAVVALQGSARRQLGRALTNQELLDLLHTIGTPSPDTIGRRPDVPAMFAARSISDGLSLDQPDVLPGGSVTATMSGSAGQGALLFA